MKRGLIQVYTGDGKGKTTAAMGLALRAAGQGLRVRIFQFLKGGSPVSGEFLGVERCNLPMGWKRFDDQIPPMFSKGDVDEAELGRRLRRALEEVREVMRAGQADVIILDEINVALGQKWLDVGDALSFLAEKPAEVELILTGRGAPPELQEHADLVTEMREIKHPFQAGIGARKGIEF
jgi:cob(I)alamin adenosyltransferase